MWLKQGGPTLIFLKYCCRIIRGELGKVQLGNILGGEAIPTAEEAC